jgi:hypothetical protein
MKFFILSMLLIFTVWNTQAQSRAVKANALYLKIVKQRKMLPGVNDTAFYRHMKQFDALEDLRSNCKSYLSIYSKSPADPKYKRVLRVHQSLKEYPVARVQFDEIMHLKSVAPLFDMSTP